MKEDGFRIVAIGGGTGLSTLLRGLKGYVGSEGHWSIDHLSAIVTVTDEGGSSGLLRKELSILPPGDVRNCIVALAEEEALLSRLFAYRFGTDTPLKGHSLGNLLLAALIDLTGSFESAILGASEVLAVRGEIYPSTLADIRIRAICDDGTELVGETAISGDHFVGAKVPQHARICRLMIDPPDPEPLSRALEAIHQADVIAIGPGSLYTSLIPNLLIPKIGEAVRTARALKVYICNVMTQPGETDGYTAEDHLRAIIEHAGLVADLVVINGRRPTETILEAYREQNQFPVEFASDAIRDLGATPFFADVVAEDDFVRHDAAALAETIFRLYDRYGRRLQKIRRSSGG